jgi:hypothetical protein
MGLSFLENPPAGRRRQGILRRPSEAVAAQPRSSQALRRQLADYLNGLWNKFL